MLSAVMPHNRAVSWRKSKSSGMSWMGQKIAFPQKSDA